MIFKERLYILLRDFVSISEYTYEYLAALVAHGYRGKVNRAVVRAEGSFRV